MIAQIGRFTVRDVSIWDAVNLLELFGDEQTVRYMGLRKLETIGDAMTLATRYATSPTKWMAVHRNDDFLGVVGLEIKDHQATMTIAFRRDWKARGAGREFSKPFVQWIFTHPQIWRVWAYCHVDNVSVQRVLERMGAECEGRLRRFEYFPNVSDEPQDCYVYSIVRD